MDWLCQNVNTPRQAEDVLRQAQTKLQKQGLYTAKIDGICGEKTKEAFQRLEKNFHHQLRISGLYSESDGYKETIGTKEAIEWVNERGIDGQIKEEADLLSLGNELSLC